ncbi:MarR family winged helix-turn-helix transcriptional regulator [Nocardiopsis flavescens]|uniref:DNA-binding transcriptional regulator, MarR family n=1 Tax=Nocardiopsis flavescens TaxID=758803 RepID=A0A1M6BW92_9ACTN|nr:MarR family transcriptional regulator [Nocardiopsis flavescens]SHI52758.1 DNA-binding transcriptional regulator, MarR family [Nocardiopsis flavescens]
MAETEGDPLALDNQLCFSLYAASRALTGLYRELLGDLGLTYPQYLVMLALWEHGTLSVKGLSRVLHLDSGTLSPLLRRLEGLGAVTRTRSTSDERVVEIGLTESGAAMRERALGIPERLACASGLPGGRVRELIATLDELTRSVETESARRPCGPE